MIAPEIHWGAVGPTLLVAAGAMLVLMLEVFLAPRESFVGRPLTRSWLGSALALVTSVVLGLAVLASWQSFLAGSSAVFNPANPLVRLDRFANFAIALIAFASLLSCLLSVGYLSELRIQHGEYYALILIAVAGMMLLVSAVDMVMVFLGLEIMSIPIYVLAGFDRRRLRSNESSLKYFLVGSFASALLLYGMALLYGATGHTDFEGIRAGWDGGPLGLVGLGLVVVGFAFKISSVPFHQWTPDVYEGAPTTVTAWMSVTVKVAAFAALLRVLAGSFPGASETGLAPLLWVLAAATMVVGNVMAVIQDNLKRLLAYSSIAHAGYLLIGLVTATPDAHAAMLFYLLAYVFTNLGAFAVIIALANKGQDTDRVEQFAGLASRRPGLAALMTLFMLSLAGIPGTVGLHGEVLSVPRRGARRRGGAHRDRGPHQRGLRLLLPAAPGRHVHARSLGSRGAPGALLRRGHGARPLRGRRGAARRLPEPAALRVPLLDPRPRLDAGVGGAAPVARLGSRGPDEGNLRQAVERPPRRRRGPVRRPRKGPAQTGLTPGGGSG